MIEITTKDMVHDALTECFPVWVTAHELAEALPVYRSTQSVREHMNKLHRMGRVERRVRDTYHSPHEYRATEGDECQ